MSLSRRQLTAIQLECDPARHYTQIEMGFACGVTERSIRNWQANDEYQAAKEAQLNRYRLDIIQESYKSILANVVAGKERSVLWVLENWDNDTIGEEATTSSEDKDAIIELLRGIDHR